MMKTYSGSFLFPTGLCRITMHHIMCRMLHMFPYKIHTHQPLPRIMACLPCSKDSISCDFFLWGYMEDWYTTNSTNNCGIGIMHLYCIWDNSNWHDCKSPDSTMLLLQLQVILKKKKKSLFNFLKQFLQHFHTDFILHCLLVKMWTKFAKRWDKIS